MGNGKSTISLRLAQQLLAMMDRIKIQVQLRAALVKDFLKSLAVEQDSVSQAAAKGSLVFFSTALALYVSGVFLFVALKWKTPSQLQPQFTIPSHWPPMEPASLQNLLRHPDMTLQRLEQKRLGLQQLLQQHDQTIADAQQHLQSLQQAVQQLEQESPTKIPKLMRSHPSKTHIGRRAPHLTTYLQSLPDKLSSAYPTPEELHEGVLLAIRELQDLLEDPTTPWDQLTAWLAAPYWRNLQWQSFDGQRYCPTTTAEMIVDANGGATTITNTNTTSTFALEDQDFVNQLVQTIRDLLAQRTHDSESWPVALEETLDELEDAYQEKVSIAQSQLKYVGGKYKRLLKKKGVADSAEVATTTSTEQCPVNHDRLMAMVEAGLDAIYRKQDLRQAIADAAASSSGDGHNIILDAILDEPWQPARASYPDAVNLRHVMDKPALKLVAKWIDNALDLVGGYSDLIDSKIDSLSQGSDDYGIVLTEKLLKQAGKISVPVPHTVQAKKMAERRT